jgi:hypothetical protein
MTVRANGIVAVVGLCAVCLPVGASTPLADRLPSGSLIYVGWAGRNLTFDGSALGQLISDPVVAKAFGALHEVAMREIRPEEQRQAFAHAWEMARMVWQRPAAAALIDLTKGEREPQPTAALLVDLGKERAAFAKHLEAILALAKEDVAFTDKTVGKVTFKVHKPRGGPQVAYGYLDDLLIVAVGEAAPESVVNLAPGKNLASDPRFAQCLEAVGGKDVQLAYYVDVAVLVRKFELLFAQRAGGEGGEAKSPAEKFRQTAAALGLEKVTAVAGTIRVVERGMYTRARVFSPAPHRGLLMPLAGAVVTDGDLAVAPADSDVLVAAKLSPSAAYAELRRVLKEIDPRSDERLGKELGELEEQLGLSLPRDVLANLGDTWVLSMAPSRGGFLTSALLTVQVKDAAKLAAAIQKMEAKLQPPAQPAGPPPAGPDAAPAPPRRPSGPRIRILRADRLEIHYLAVPSRHEPWPVAPAWAIHKDRFYLAAYPQVIQAAITQNGSKPLTQDADFQAARGRIAGKPSAIVYANVPRIARQLYNAALVGWTLAANALAAKTGAEAAPDWLPPLSSLDKYLRPQICTVSSDAEGISFEGYGSFPTPSWLVPLLLNPAPVWVLLSAAPQMPELGLAQRR